MGTLDRKVHPRESISENLRERKNGTLLGRFDPRIEDIEPQMCKFIIFRFIERCITDILERLKTGGAISWSEKKNEGSGNPYALNATSAALSSFFGKKICISLSVYGMIILAKIES